MKELMKKISNKTRKKAVRTLAGIVAFATAYSLILPAITIDQETAEEEPGMVLNENENAEEALAEYEAPEEVVEEAPQKEPAAEEAPAEEVKEEAPAEEPAVEEKKEEAPAEEAKPAEETKQEETKPAEEPKQEEAEIVLEATAGKLEYKADKDYTVTIEYTKDAGFIEGTELEIRETLKEDEYANSLVKAQKEFEEDGEIVQARFFETLFKAGEEEYKTAEGKVIVTYEPEEMEIEDNQEVIVLVTDKEGEYEEVDEKKLSVKEKENKIEEIKFETEDLESFNIIVIEKEAEEEITETPSEEPAEETQEAETAMPAASFSKTADDVIVTVDAPEGAFPEGTEMEIELVDEAPYMDAINSTISEDETVKTAQAVDIRFIYNGEEIEPQKEIKVNLISSVIKQTEDPKLIHIDNEGSASIVDATQDTKTYSEEINNLSKTETVESLTFTSDAFSVYVIVGTETITIEHIDHKGTKYEVTVTYGPEAKIPDGSTLSVTDIEEGTDAYDYARKAVLADKQAKGEEVFLPEFGFAALDISILNPEGEEIEPEAPVQVDIKIKSLPNVENLNDVADSIEIQHHVETGDKVVVDTVYDGGATEATFDVVTNEMAIAAGTAVDPNSYVEKTTNNLDEEEIEASFEVEAFSTYSINYYYNYYSKRIHYVDTNGNSLTPTMTPNFNNRYAFLIYDIEGYEYDSTHYNSRTGTEIQPIVRASDNDGFYYSGNIQYRNGNSWSNLGNGDIYVVYKAKTSPTTGGTVTPTTDEDWPDEEDPARLPQFGKSSTNNGNGTNTISLSIAGPEKAIENSTKANVIVVFDVSGSMSEDLNGRTRLYRAQTAVNRMADTLLNKKDSQGNNLVKMGLVSFSTTATTVVSLTDAAATNPSTYKQRVNALEASGGTNWEQALAMANRMTVDSDAATFIVFVTDGDPTFRVSRGNYADASLDVYNNTPQIGANNSTYYTYYRNNHVFGTGYGTLNENNNTRNFNAAVNEGKTIISSNKNFYAIGVSNAVTSVQNLVTQSGGSASNAYLATNSTALDEAFEAIANSISASLGFGNIEVTDGITSLTNAEIKAVNVDPTSFKYYRYGGTNNKYGNGYANKTEWTTREADGCAAASYNSETGAVQWNMGESFQLENDVSYVVEFIVWPGQDAYDLAADLNNGKKTYSSLTQTERDQVVELTAPTYDSDGNMLTTGTYALKTNTSNVKATYNRTTKSGDVVTISDETNLNAEYHEGNIQNMTLDDSYVTITKEWINVIPGDTRVARTVNLAVTRDNVTYISPITLSQENDWTSGNEYISAGVITHVSDTTGTYRIREPGHEYTVSEPEDGNNGYYWDLTTDIYRPMVIDGTLHVLIKTSNPTGTEGTDYYVIGGNSYQVRDGSTHMTATNNRRSVLDLSKEVIKEEGATDNPNPDTLFTYTIKITGTDGADIWFSAQDKDGATVTIPTTSSNVVAEMGADSTPTGYYYVPSGAEFTITMKAEWTVRFINLPNGTTYSIEETGVGEGYEFVEANTSVTNTSGENLGTPGTVNEDVVTGTINKPNNEFDVDYTNKWLSKEIKIVKVDENGDNLADATFTLTRGRETVTTFTSKADEGETLNVGKGTYCLTETAAPAGYIILTNKIYFNVNADGTVALSDEDGETDGVSYDNAVVSNPPDVEVGTVTISNEPGAALPNTGGSGTLPYTLGGIALIMASALMYGFRMRRRERRLDN